MVELTSYINYAYASFNKTTPLISKYFLRFQINLLQVYKYLNGLSPDDMSDIFKLRENTHNLRNFNTFESQSPRTKKFGIDSIAYTASQLRKNVPHKS